MEAGSMLIFPKYDQKIGRRTGNILLGLYTC